MGGGLMQLVAYGAQDIYLTGNPQITFFKVVYRRHTNFSMESIQQTFNGTTGFGNTVTATISRNGDLVGRMYLEHDAAIEAASADGTVAVVAQYGSKLIKECEIEIGGQRIDRHYGHWLSAYTQLTELNPTAGNTTLFNKMTGNGNAVASGADNAISNNGCWTTADNSAKDVLSGKFFIPLQFWFCRNAGLALPLIALQYHEVKVKMTFESLSNLAASNAAGGTEDFIFDGDASEVTNGQKFNLWADYIYLDTDERRRFAQVSHEYLIEQVQHENHVGGGTMSLNFNHPVKELVWTREQTTFAAATNLTNQLGMNHVGAEMTLTTGAGTGTSGDSWLLKLNGHDRFAARPTKYFTRAQVWQHHTGCGGVVVPDSIGVYSFSLKPEEHQPSGTCNFSRIDNAQLVGPTYTAAVAGLSAVAITAGVNVYAVNYNVLRIMSGMGGLAYSN